MTCFAIGRGIHHRVHTEIDVCSKAAMPNLGTRPIRCSDRHRMRRQCERRCIHRRSQHPRRRLGHPRILPVRSWRADRDRFGAAFVRVRNRSMH